MTQRTETNGLGPEVLEKPTRWRFTQGTSLRRPVNRSISEWIWKRYGQIGRSASKRGGCGREKTPLVEASGAWVSGLDQRFTPASADASPAHAQQAEGGEEELRCVGAVAN